MIRSSLRNLVIACVVLGPAELSSQWQSSWLDYRGTIDGSYTATCPTAAGVVPRAGKVRFNFSLSGNAANTNFQAEWYGDQSTRWSTDQIAADGTASGKKVYFSAGGSISWFGRFRRGSDGSIQASGAISPEPGDERGCTGTWSAAAAAEPSRPGQPAVANAATAVCEEFRARISAAETQTSLEFASSFRNLQAARSEVLRASRVITAIKNADPEYESNVVFGQEQSRRREAYAEITRLSGVVKQIEQAVREVARIRNEAIAAGCGGIVAPDTRTRVDAAVDELVKLDSPPSPSTSPATSPSAEILGVAGVKGEVEVHSQDGTRYSPKDGARIGLNTPITVRTWAGSSVTIQVGSARKTLQPNTTIRIVTTLTGQTYVLEEGAAAVDVRKPGAYQIETPTATANVDGTVFTVSYDAKTGATGVMVEEGRVTLRSKNPGQPALRLAPGEYAEVTRHAMSAVLPAPGASENVAANPQIYPPVTAQNIDLTGLWRDDTGGGAIYRLRQVGDWVYWLVDGTPNGSYVNLSYGRISGNTITGTWVDMPGSPSLGGGNLTLRIESNDRLVKVGASGYGAQAWIRVSNTGGNRQ